jgi:hypothetical protein
VGLPDAILFLRISRVGVFQHPRLIATTTPDKSLDVGVKSVQTGFSPEEIAYRLRPRQRMGLLLAMMSELAGHGARISFEGRLSQTELTGIDGVSFEEKRKLVREGVSFPPLDFLVLPLTSPTIPKIEKAIVSKIAFSYEEIVHIQIEKQGLIAFGAYDGFHEECVIASSAIPAALLTQLVRDKVLESYFAV